MHGPGRHPRLPGCACPTPRRETRPRRASAMRRRPTRRKSLCSRYAPMRTEQNPSLPARLRSGALALPLTSFRFDSFWKHSRNGSEGSGLRCNRQAYHKRRSFRFRIVVTHDLAAMFADDSVTDTQPQSRPLAHFLGREKWIKNALRIADPDAVVAERDFNPASGASAHDLDPSCPPGFAHGVIGVVENIQEDLLQLMRVAHDLRQS